MKDVEKYTDAELQFFFCVLAMVYTDLVPHTLADVIVGHIRKYQIINSSDK
jgi:hypothetical protein